MQPFEPSVLSLSRLIDNDLSENGKKSIAALQALSIKAQTIRIGKNYVRRVTVNPALEHLCTSVIDYQINHLHHKIDKPHIEWFHPRYYLNIPHLIEAWNKHHVYAAVHQNAFNLLFFADKPIGQYEPQFSSPRPVSVVRHGTLLTFHPKNMLSPLVRCVRVSLVPEEAEFDYKKTYRLYQNKTSLERNPSNRGFSTFHSFFPIAFPYNDGRRESALLTVDMKLRSLKRCRAALADTPFTHGIIPIMRDVLQVVAKSHGFNHAVVLRRLSLNAIKIQQNFSLRGSLYWSARVPKSILECDAGTSLDKNPWIKPLKHMRFIRYMSPEMLEKLQIDGTLSNSKPETSHDVWALGIIFADFVWPNELPSYICTLKSLAEAIKDKEPDLTPELFNEAKQAIISGMNTFYSQNQNEMHDQLKAITLSMLAPKPIDRISAGKCLEKIDLLAKLMDLPEKIGPPAFI